MLIQATGIAALGKEPGDIWLGAYEVYEKAEKFYEKEDYSSAMVYYGKALTKFEELKDKYPSWNTELVLYRITYCEERDTLIRNKLAIKKKKLPEDELVKENIEIHSKLVDYQEQLSSEQSKLKEALNKIESGSSEIRKNAAAAEKLKEVLKEKIELEKK